MKNSELPIWQTGKVNYITTNIWTGIPKHAKESCKRRVYKGVEGRLLTSDHPLCGEYGLFATKHFSRFDVIGEYIGKVVSSDKTGHYVAALEDAEHDKSLGLDAEFCGNEMRFINSYLGIANRCNVVMKTVYIDTLPHIIIICTEDISPGEEILFDYGESYNNAYLLPESSNCNDSIGSTVTLSTIETTPVSRTESEVSLVDIQNALPFCDSISETEGEE